MCFTGLELIVNCIVNYEDVRMSGGFSFEILSSGWTSHEIVKGLKDGLVTVPHMIDGGPLYSEGRIIAKIVKSLPKIDFGVAEMQCEKNMKVPYFFGFEDKSDVMLYFIDPDVFFADKEILLATKHIENDGYGNFLVIVKDSHNQILYLHIEDTIRTRTGPNKFYTDNFLELRSVDTQNLSRLHFAREYKEIIQSMLTSATSV